ncbi:hypothetical protein ES703_91295 [subsurface metagenome]
MVLKTLEKEPERRYQHASEVKADVETIADDVAPPQPSGRTDTVEDESLEQFILSQLPATKIEAIKAYQEKTGASRVEAVLAVDAITRKYGIEFVRVPLKHRLPGMLILVTTIVVFFVLYILFKRHVELSPIITRTVIVLFGGGYFIFFSVAAWRSRAIDKGLQFRFFAGFFLFLFVATPLLLFLAEPRPILERLYNFTGATPGRHDVLFFRIVLIAIVLGFLFWLIRFIIRLRKIQPIRHTAQVKTGVEAISSGGRITPPAGNAAQVSRMEKHITIVAVLSIFFSTLGILVGIITFVAIVGGGLISGDLEAMSITGIVGTCIALFFFITSVPGLIAGIGLLKRKGWARILALILAIPNLMNIPIGTAIGIYVIWVLLNEETAKLFAHASAGRKKQQAVQTKPNRRGLLIGLVVAGIVIVMTALLTLPIILPVLFLATSRSSTRQSPPFVETYTVAEQAGQLDLPYGTPEDLTFGPEGPTLSNECIQTLELELSEIAQVHKILRRAYRQYFELERQNTQQYRAVNSLTVIISPFRQEAENFLKQFWADLDSILDEQKRTLARRHLPLGQMFGTFQFGGPTITISVSKENGMFSYYTTYKWPKGSGKSGKGTSKGGGSTLPPKYRRFWEEPATKDK